MKELSIEEKAKAYDEAIEKAKSLLSGNQLGNTWIYKLLPELKESEDEKIRKGILELVRQSTEILDKQNQNKMIAWLDKQGKKMSDPRYSILDKLIEADDIYQMSVNAEMIETAKNKAIDTLSKLEITKLLELEKQGERKTPQWMIDFLDNYRRNIGCSLDHDEAKDVDGKILCIKEWLEKQGEQKNADKFIEEEKPLLEKFKQAVYDCAWEKVTCKKEGETKEEYANRWAEHFLLKVRDWADDYIDFTISQKERNSYNKGYKAAPEKQGEQKSTSKAEPKFRNGQWIVWQDKCYKVNYNGCGYELIDQNGLSTSLEYGTVDENAHLWDITKDANDGDVLISQYGNPLIYNGNYNSLNIGAYCGITCDDNKFKVAEEKCHWTENVDIKPATKEQRDLLFQKMKEAGYQWDAEKKEPKKIEQKPADKVEPKYEIIKDTWYICTCTTCTEDSRIWFKKGVAYLGSDILKYDLGFEPNDYQDYFRLWTIQDAKDGDVLIDKSGSRECPFIFKETKPSDIKTDILNPLTVLGYCGIGGAGFTKGSGWGDTANCIYYPATKEQRELLFQKMKEAGYQWDAEKKEPKKIEQKTADKVEPKFHKGEWIVWKNKCYKVNYNGCGYELIDQNGLSTSLEYGTVDENAHLWTIKDAKDGDILFQDLMDGKTFIFNGINPDMAILYSFIIRNDGEDVLPYDIGKPNTGIGFIEENKNIIHPATKEQRDLLFGKMKEVGYEWDVNKKQLERIIDENQIKKNLQDNSFRRMFEQNPAWSEEDEKRIENILRVLDVQVCWGSEGKANPYQKEIDWLNYLKNRVEVKDVDLAAEISHYIKQHQSELKGYYDIRRIARHFFELGIKARKG